MMMRPHPETGPDVEFASETMCASCGQAKEDVEGERVCIACDADNETIATRITQQAERPKRSGKYDIPYFVAQKALRTGMMRGKPLTPDQHQMMRAVIAGNPQRTSRTTQRDAASEAP